MPEVISTTTQDRERLEMQRSPRVRVRMKIRPTSLVYGGAYIAKDEAGAEVILTRSDYDALVSRQGTQEHYWKIAVEQFERKQRAFCEDLVTSSGGSIDYAKAEAKSPYSPEAEYYALTGMDRDPIESVELLEELPALANEEREKAVEAMTASLGRVLAPLLSTAVENKKGK